MKKITNNESMQFKDISHETYRCYTFPGGDKVTIKEPKALHVSPSGGHRVQDGTGAAHYIPTGWIHLTWETSDDCSFWF